MFIAGWYPTGSNITGIFIKEHANAIAIYNDIVVLHSEGIDHSLRGLYTISDEVEDGLRTIRLHYRKSPIPGTTYLIILLGMFGIFRKLVKQGFKPDIIHANIYTAGFHALLLGKYYGIPLVITEHSSAFPLGTIKGINRLKARFALNGADLVIPVSKDLVKHIRNYGIRNTFKVIPNVVNTKLFYPDPNRKGRDIKRILFVAKFDRKKGVPYLLKALASLREERKDFILDVVGDGPYREEYKKLAFKLGIEEIVNFHGIKAKEEVARFMRKADFFVLPSEWENLPCVLIEAMASGLPVIATEVGGIPEIVKENIGKLVPPKNSKKLAKVIDTMLDNLNDYSTSQISKYAKENFSYRNVGQKLCKIYKEVLNHV